jgi:hypothetical protein
MCVRAYLERIVAIDDEAVAALHAQAAERRRQAVAGADVLPVGEDMVLRGVRRIS